MEFADRRWRQIIAGGITPHALSIAVFVVAIVGYTLALAFGPGGEPDQGSLQQFNTAFSNWTFPLLAILLTTPAAGVGRPPGRSSGGTRLHRRTNRRPDRTRVRRDDGGPLRLGDRRRVRGVKRY